jgi:hypothetical protein
LMTTAIRRGFDIEIPNNTPNPHHSTLKKRISPSAQRHVNR